MDGIILVALSLAIGFILQVVWWRVFGANISSVLFLFLSAFAGMIIASFYGGLLSLSLADYVRLALLYLSVVLAYSAVCSAVEVPSPTLSMIIFIAQRAKTGGCREDDLVQGFIAQGSVGSRLKLMESSGLIGISDGRCALTKKGFLVGRLFEFSARFFDLPIGG
jgi:hypothetical protein